MRGRKARKQLKTAHALRIHQSLYPGLDYLYRLRDRMEKTGDRNDPLYQLVSTAYEATKNLGIELHRQSCKSLDPLTEKVELCVGAIPCDPIRSNCTTPFRCMRFPSPRHFGGNQARAAGRPPEESTVAWKATS